MKRIPFLENVIVNTTQNNNSIQDNRSNNYVDTVENNVGFYVVILDTDCLRRQSHKTST